MTEHSALSFSDIKLLMENYQNMIQLNTILLEQQKQVIELQRNISNKQDDILVKQNTTCDQLIVITNKLEDCTKNLQSINKSIQDSCNKLGDSINDKLYKTDEKTNSWKIDVIKQHSSINRNVYIAWGGMVTIIIALSGLLITSYEKFSIVNKIYFLLQELSKYFNLG